MFFVVANSSQLHVMRLYLEESIFVNQSGTFAANVSWEKPLFSYSQIEHYALDFLHDNVSEYTKIIVSQLGVVVSC